MTVNLLNFDKTRMNDFCVQMGERSFHAKQLLRWVHQYGESDFSKMSDLTNAFRGKLTDTACVVPPKLVSESTATDGTRKWVLSVGNDNCIETVFIPEENRGTLCISSQVGCALACTFCATGRQGFNKNLSTAEIIGQLWWANKALGHSAKSERIVSNVVFMGMGEPLLNYDNVVTALNVMLDDSAYGLSRRRVTLSTSGIVPAIDRLREECPVALAVSLHASNDVLRDILVPMNSRYPLQELMAACKRYVERAPRDFITFEYVMLKDVNDGAFHARELIRLVADVPCKFNLIPFNPFLNSGYERSTPEAITQFRNILVDGGIITTVRKTRGDDIAAACGQLSGQVQDKVNRQMYQQIGIK